MQPDFARTAELLEQDVARTLGPSHRPVVHAAARAVACLELADSEATLVEDVQQRFHDRFVDTTWPACPRHPAHPLWYAEGAWWCTQDRVMIARLGELPARSRPAG